MKTNRIRLLETISRRLNSSPVDAAPTPWGSQQLTSQYIADNLDRAVSKHGRLFRRKRIGDHITLYIYAYPSYQLFEAMKSDPLLRECRGIILSPLGVRVRPFPVIPTVPWDDIHKLIDEDNTTLKINGKMVTGLVDGDRVTCIGKGGDRFNVHPKYVHHVETLLKDANGFGLTALFEITDKHNPLVLREDDGCYLVGLRSNLSGRMATATDLVKVAGEYELDKVTIVTTSDLPGIAFKEGVVVNDGLSMKRAKTPFFKSIQQITSILRFNRKGNLADLLRQVKWEHLEPHLSDKEKDKIRQINRGK